VQFEVLVNGMPQFVAGIAGEGHVGVHVNTRPPAESAAIHAGGYQNVPGGETLFQKWSDVPLQLGAEVTIRLVSDREATPSVSRRSSRDDDRISVRSPKTAREVHRSVLSLQQDLLAMLPLVESEAPEDAKRFKVAVATILSAFADHFLGPLYNAHPDLRPPELQGVPL
jgi:hypothetical protein